MSLIERFLNESWARKKFPDFFNGTKVDQPRPANGFSVDEGDAVRINTGRRGEEDSEGLFMVHKMGYDRFGRPRAILRHHNETSLVAGKHLANPETGKPISVPVHWLRRQ